MRSGLWAIACAIGLHNEVLLSKQGLGLAVFITIVMLIMDGVEFLTRNDKG